MQKSKEQSKQLAVGSSLLSACNFLLSSIMLVAISHLPYNVFQKTYTSRPLYLYTLPKTQFNSPRILDPQNPLKVRLILNRELQQLMMPF
jgi:hypothetical protein